MIFLPLFLKTEPYIENDIDMVMPLSSNDVCTIVLKTFD